MSNSQLPIANSLLTIIYLAGSVLLALWLTIPFSKWLANRLGAIDLPGKHKIHLQPIPRLGGLGILLAFGLSNGALLAALVERSPLVDRQTLVLLSLLPGVAVIGFLDDIRGLPEWLKFGGEGLIALGLILLLAIGPGWLAIAAWFWIVGLINGYNFLDGLDGLAAGVAVIHLLALAAMFSLAGCGLPALAAAGLAMAVLGFLRYNWTPATIFMGDSGSLSLGFAVAALSLRLIAHENFSAPAGLAVILLAGLPLGDVALTSLRRLVNRQPLFPADRGHFYDQMIAKKGVSKLNAVRLSLLAAIATGGLGLMTFVLPLPLAMGPFLLELGGLLLVAHYFKISFRWEY